jgi:transposase-like protein
VVSVADDRRNGRPSLLTPDVQARICAALAVGAYRCEAARLAGVHPNRLGDWLRRGRQDRAAGRDGAHTRLLDAVEAAEAAAGTRRERLAAQLDATFPRSTATETPPGTEAV